MITSHSNERIKLARSLRDRKNREKHSLFYAEGLRIVAEAIQQDIPVEFIISCPDLLVSEFARGLLAQAFSKSMPILEVSRDVFQNLAQKEGPQGLSAVLHQKWGTLPKVGDSERPLWIALHETADPGNLGTIMRTCDAVGGMGIILLDNTVDPYSPASIRASMGAIFTLHIVRESFHNMVVWKEANGLKLIGVTGTGDQEYHKYAYPDSMILLLGSERQGLPEEQTAYCDGSVRIPMAGRCDSLNLSIAAGIVMYQAFTQRIGRPIQKR